MAALQGTADALSDRLQKLKPQYSNRPELITRLHNAGLSPNNADGILIEKQ